MIVTQPGLWEFIPTVNIKILKPVKKRPQKPRNTVARFLHLGAGVQSSTIVEMIVEGDLPRVDGVIFADTGNEPKHVYKQVAYLKTRLDSVGIPLYEVKKPQSAGIAKDFMSAAGRFATMPLYTRNSVTGAVGILRRQCTNEYKIIPCDNFILDWMIERGHASPNSKGARRVGRGVQVENIYGISADEKERQGKRGPAWQKACYPLIDMNMGRVDCEAYLLAKGLRIPKKSSCKICPYHSDPFWYWMSVNTPDEFEETCCFDDWLRSPLAIASSFKQGRIHDEVYLHPSCQPLRSIDFKAIVEAKKTAQQSMFKIELVAGAKCASDGGFTCMS